jgi:PAS domain S-box-containing protein
MTKKPSYEELEHRVRELEKETLKHKRVEQALEELREYAENIVATVREPLVVLDADLRVVSTNHSFYRVFAVKPEETEGQFVYDLGNRQWNIPRLRELLEEIIPKNNTFEGFQMEHDFPTIGRRIMLLNARRIPMEADETRLILLAIEDVTERVEMEEALQKSS